MRSTPRRWPDLRALSLVFVLLHGLTVLVLSVPPPPPGLRGDKPDPQTERALSAWVGVAAGLGLPREAVDSAMRQALPAWSRLLGAVQAPLRPYARLVGANQSWRMFGVVSDKVATVEIDVALEGQLLPLYRVPSPEHRWQATLLRQERVRALFNQFERRRSRKRWDSLVERLSERYRGEGGQGELIFRMRAFTIPPPAALAETGQLEPGKAYWEVRR